MTKTGKTVSSRKKGEGPKKGKSAAGRALKTGAAAALVTLSSVSVFRAVAATATLPVLARIVRAIEITVNTSLDFGTIALTEDVAAKAVLDPYSGNLKLDGEGGVNLAGGYPRAGNVRIKGAPIPVHVSLHTNNLRLTNGTTHLTVNDFNINTAKGGPEATVTPSGPGNSIILSIGATMSARPQQLTGTYIGVNTIFADYQ